MELILESRYGYDLKVVIDNTKVETDVTHLEWNKDDEGKLKNVRFREPNDEVTNQVVSLLEDIAYYRTSDIQHTDNLIVELFNKKSELDRKNLLMILNNTFGEEDE